MAHPALRRIAIDAGPALVLLVAVQAEVAAYDGDHRAALAAIGALATLPLALRRRFALPCHAAVAAAIGLVALVEPGFESLSVLFALVLSMAALATEEAWPSALVGAGMAATALAVAIGRDPSDSSAASVPPTLLLFVGVPLAAGVALRRRQHRADSHLAQAAEAGARERRRIARELHDVVAHGVSVMVIQAQAAQRVLASDPGAAREALGAIEATGRDAMGELRTLLGLLRDDGDAGTVGPAPGLAGLPDLTRRLAESGLDVDVRVTGVVEPLAPGVDRSAYRIVQESLTNALRHGRDGRAEVVIGYGPRSVDLEIGNPAGASNGAPGLGVAGMRERASALGGTLGTGLEGTRYVVRASLPR